MAYEWDGQPVVEFLLWTRLGNERHPQWHRGKTSQALEAGRPDGFTYDAVFDGSRHPHGTELTANSAAEGVLVSLKPTASAPASAPAQAQAPAQAPVPAPAQVLALAPIQAQALTN